MKTDEVPITIFRYDTAVASVKNRVTLQQNLFSFLLEGEKTVFYAGSTITIDPCQFLLLSAGNCLMSEMTAVKGGAYRSLLIKFDNKILADFFTAHPDLLRTKASKLEEEPVLLFEKDAFLHSFLGSLDLMLDKPLSAGMQLLKLNELLLYLGESCPGQLQKLRNSSQEAGDEIQIRQAVNANIGQPVSVEELAFLCNMSLSTFKRRFAKIYGTSPNKWLIEKRMAKAAELLKQGGYKASDIYYELGYENLSSFIQSFKQAHGVTPKQYQLTN
ncbi:AraC-type DNA-binding protein [Mucilaginibacter lappiensis]|uniref:AraC-like DNA-binding protein n=1 Tax=Mucilaginibacter lappiensis TaxID=354630 RepID=A0ABR6PHD9_9SPHI|nr:AraC family transcriptional regulator [Mucilaginibacter lappiensis]MBB6107626.1 AraC-like DNA-binding protein [Mucilaginibacter lappiensis]SIQ02472.1 AraC-type DNA-binding protein [Mucilaginibacter lappiensis]